MLTSSVRHFHRMSQGRNITAKCIIQVISRTLKDHKMKSTPTDPRLTRERGQQQSETAIFRIAKRFTATCRKDSRTAAPTLLWRLQTSRWHWKILCTWTLHITMLEFTLILCHAFGRLRTAILNIRIHWALGDKGTRDRFCWTLSHCGIEGDEIMDQLAKEALDHDLKKSLHDSQRLHSRISVRSWVLSTEMTDQDNSEHESVTNWQNYWIGFTGIRNLFIELMVLWGNPTCLGRMIRIEGCVSTLSKSNPANKGGNLTWIFLGDHWISIWLQNSRGNFERYGNVISQ